MGLSFKPEFSLSANDKDITALIKERLVSLTLTDNAGDESDRLAFTIDLPSQYKTPEKGATLKLALGFNGELIDKGSFFVDEVTVTGPPRLVQVVANAAPVTVKKEDNSDSEKTAAALQSMYQSTWENFRIEDIVSTVANRHGLKQKVADEFKDIRVFLTQDNESDMNLMTRLAKNYGAVSKIANGYWLFIKEGSGKTVSGQKLKDIDIKLDEVTNYQFTFNSRGDAQRVVASYFDVVDGLTKEVSVGAGEPEFRIAFKYPNLQEAEAGALAKANRAKKGSSTCDITLPASIENIPLVAEGSINLSGFGNTEDGLWTAKTVEWSLSSSGMQLRINGEIGV